MVVSVHNTSKPALGRRAFWMTLVLLLGTIGLAYQMTSYRDKVRLGDRIASAGWGISFAPPQSFERRISSRPELFIPFVGYSQSGSMATLIVWQHGDLGESDPDEIIPLIFQQIESPSQTNTPVDVKLHTERKMFGELEGVEKFNTDRTSLVRLAVYNHREVYAISLSVAGDDPIDAKLYDTVDKMCQSVIRR